MQEKAEQHHVYVTWDQCSLYLYLIIDQFVLQCMVNYVKPCGSCALSKVPKRAILKDKRGMSGFVLINSF